MAKKKPDLSNIFAKTEPSEGEPIDDKVRAYGVGLKASEWAAFEAIAERMGVTRYNLAAWALRYFMDQYESGSLPVREEKRETLPGLEP